MKIRVDSGEGFLDEAVQIAAGVEGEDLGAEEGGDEADGTGAGTQGLEAGREVGRVGGGGGEVAGEDDADEVDLAGDALLEQGVEGAALGGGEVRAVEAGGGRR